MPTNSLSLSNLTLSPDYIDSASRIMFQQAFLNATLSDYHTIYQGITYNQYMGFLRPDLISGKSVGTCGVPQQGATITPYQKQWTPVKTASKTFICLDDLTSVANKFLGTLPDQSQEQKAESEYLMELLSQKIAAEIGNSIFLKVWLGDTAAAIAPSGKFSTGFDLGFINQNDGLLKQCTTIPSSQYLAITENSQTTTDGQVLTSARAFEIVNTLYKTKATSLLKGQRDKIFYVSETVYDGLREAAVSTSNIGTYGLTLDIKAGQPASIYFFDIEVKPCYNHSQFIKAYKSYTILGQALLGNPHFAVLTTKDNIPVGLGSVNSLTDLKMYPELGNYGFNIDWTVLYDSKILDTNLIAAAYE